MDVVVVVWVGGDVVVVVWVGVDVVGVVGGCEGFSLSLLLFVVTVDLASGRWWR